MRALRILSKRKILGDNYGQNFDVHVFGTCGEFKHALHPNIAYDPWMMLSKSTILSYHDGGGEALRKAPMIVPFSKGGLIVCVGNFVKGIQIFFMLFN